jgi:hypothetical protein
MRAVGIATYSGSACGRVGASSRTLDTLAAETWEMLDGAGVTTSSAEHASKPFVTNTNKSSLPWQGSQSNPRQRPTSQHGMIMHVRTRTIGDGRIFRNNGDIHPRLANLRAVLIAANLHFRYSNQACDWCV